ncbi:MAG: reverse transcriptase family protein [Deltaproteobacteria bacterium]|nr:reverse transcriptase family protein [Deltaproteobacteria bacterium]
MAPTPALAKIAEGERERRVIEQAARVKRQADIDEAGSIEKWLQLQLVAAGLAVTDDPATLTDAQKKGYKEKKKAEAVEKRRLRKLAWQAYHATHINHLGSAVFYNDLVDIDKFDIERREERAKDLGLPDWTTPAKLATALGLSISRMRWMAFHKDVDTGSHYIRFTIPKRDGSARQITAPKADLKRVQRHLLDNLLDRLAVHSAAHGFIARKSIQTNALVHAGADVVVKVDIKDFFPTITLPRVKGLLRKAGMPEQVATIVALLCTESPRDVVDFRGQTLYVATGARALPQGSPASPMITNALCMRLDKRMAGLGRKLGLTYTRYADDLTFSYKKLEPSSPSAPLGPLLHGVKVILQGEGFQLNDKKTTVMGGGARQVVTGLIINKRPQPNKGAASSSTSATRVPREVIRKLRAAIHNRQKGKATAFTAEGGESLAHLRGLAAFVFQSDPLKGRAFLDQIDALEAAASN